MVKIIQIRRKKKSYKPYDMLEGGEVPKYLFRGSDNFEQLKKIPKKGFMVGTSAHAAGEYGQYIAVYEFLGGTVTFGTGSVLTDFREQLAGATLSRAEVNNVSCKEAGYDLILPAYGEDNEHAVICNTKRLRLLVVGPSHEIKRYSKGL